MHVVGRRYAVRISHIYPTCADIHTRGVPVTPGVRRKNRSNTIFTHRFSIYLYPIKRNVSSVYPLCIFIHEIRNSFFNKFLRVDKDIYYGIKLFPD